MKTQEDVLADLDDQDIRELYELEDGTSVYEIGPPEKEEVEEEGSFYRNLAGTVVKDSALKKLSVFLLEAISKDVDASDKWIKSLKKVKEYLGFDVEDLKNSPFKEATRTYDTTLANALLKYYAHIRSELLPNTGPVGYRLNGNTSEDLEEKGEKVRDFLNNYLLRVDKAFYADYERFLLHLGFNGSSCRKIYYDKFLNRPMARFITAEDFIIDADCNSINDSQRITHVLHLSKRDILLNQQNGIYRDVELPFLKTMETSDEVLKNESSTEKENVDLSVYEKRSLFPIYECHVYLNLDDFNDSNNIDENSIPLPFIVIIDPNSKEILSICRNWKEQDPNKERINYFVLYNLMAGFGIRGLGFAQMLGSNAISLTTILRELIDAGKFQNLPGGLRKQGASKQQQNNIVIGPGEFVQVDTFGEDLEKVFMPLPYSGPSQALSALSDRVIEQTKELGATGELGMLDSREAIAPSTLIMALENNNKIQNVISESIHCSFNQELQLIYDIFKQTLDDDFSEYVNGREITINDFVDEIEIIPVSNPSYNSTIHKLVRAQSMLETAMMAPDQHNMYEVFKYNYKAQGIPETEIDKILPDPAAELSEEILPLDPVTENLNIAAGKPVKAAKWQDHASHELMHGIFAEQNADKPELQAEALAHIKEHQAMRYLIQMEQILGYELPSLEELTDPEVQNHIAFTLAQNINQTVDENTPPPPIDPNQLILADIQQKEKQAEVQERIANMKAETDVFKTQMEFEKSKAKIESEEDIAVLRAETELIKQGIQNG
jgi:hypothetical protein